jgi:transcriptional regulator with XRE-family HTH domain
MNALADVSGVPVSTISRIESGAVEPTWSMMSRLTEAAGFRLDPHLTESGSDEPFASVLRQFGRGSPAERARLLKRFPVVAQLALVARRHGARRIQLDTPLNEAVSALNGQGQHPVVSSTEAFAGDITQDRSFSPVVYVDRPGDAAGFLPGTRTSHRTAFLLPTTGNVRDVTHDIGGVMKVSREWALLDSLASPGRQADASLHLLDSLVEVAA